MASYLHYQFWTQIADGPPGSATRDGRLLSKISSGTIALSSTPSAGIAIPKQPSTILNAAAVLKVIGTDRAYVEFRAPGTTAAAQTSAHLATDAVPRTLVGAEDGAILERLPEQGTMTVVMAAALT